MGRGETQIKTRSAPVPAYTRIVDTVSRRIGEGIYPPGSRLPSESQFSAEFGVSPMTLRKALAILSERGLIYAEKGRGTFVRPIALSDAVFHLEELGTDLHGDSAQIRLLEVATIKASAEVASMLAIEPGDRVAFLRRLITKNQTPAAYHVEYLVFDPYRPLIESQLQLTTLHGVLEAARGQGFPRGSVSLRATSLTDGEAEMLAVAAGSPALRLEHVFEDSECRPVSWGWFLMRADMFLLSAQLGPGHDVGDSNYHE